MSENLYSTTSWLPTGLRSKLSALAAAVLLAPAAWAQIEVPAGNPNANSGRKPLGTYFGYERSAMIYTAAEIGTSGNLTNIGFYLNSVSSPSAAPTKIYLKTVTNATFAAATTVAAEETGATLVYDSTIPAASFTANTWVTVPLTAPFAYNGTSNLEVIVETNATGAGNETSTAKVFRYGSTGTGTNRTQFWQADTNPPTTTGTLGILRPNIRLTGLAPLACPPISNLNVSNITLTSAQLSFTPGASSTSYTVTYTPTGGTATTVTPAPTTSPITLSGLALGTTYTVSITGNCAGSTTSQVVTTTFTTPAVANDDPSGAIALPIAATCTPLTTTNTGATTTTPNGYANPGVAPNACGIAASPKDVWYTFTTAASGAGSTSVSIQVTGNPAGYIRAFSAASAAGPFTELRCASGGAINTVSLPLNLTGLTPSTTYYVSVAGYGSTDTQGAFTICASSTAAAVCAAPTAVSVGSITATTASLVFTPGAGNTSYTVTYYPTATPTATTTVTPAPTASPVALTGLTANTAYTVTLQPLCTSGATTGLITRTFTTLGTAPANDNCTGAIALTASTTCTVTTVSNANATASTAPAPSCGGTVANNDIWYSIVVPANGTVTVTTSAVTGSPFTDSVVELYSGACTSLTSVGCNDDATGAFSAVTATGLTAGSTIYARVFSYSTTATGQFGICVTTPAPLPGTDASVDAIFAVGKAPISAPQITQAVIRNGGASVLTNVPVSLIVTGATVFTNTKTIASLAVGASTTITFDPYTPAAVGNNTVTVSVPADGLNTNNSRVYAQAVTTNSLSYIDDSQALNPTGVGVSSTVPGGTLAARYTISSSSNIGEVKLNFPANATTTSTYQVVVLSATTAGLPNAVLFTSPTLNRPTAAGVVTVPVTGATVNGTFFVGLKEVSGNVAIGYQVEDPLRPNTFYYQASAAGAWTDVNTTPLRTRLAIEVGFSTRVLSNRSAVLEQAMSVFPNPAHHDFTLRLPAIAGQRTAQLTLLNTLGQQVQSRIVQLNAAGTDTQMDVSNLAKGIYTLRVQTADQVATKQVSVE